MAIAICTYLCENTFLTQVCALLVCSFVGAVKMMDKHINNALSEEFAVGTKNATVQLEGDRRVMRDYSIQYR